MQGIEKQSLSSTCAGYSPLRSLWRSISGRRHWHGLPHISGPADRIGGGAHSGYGLSGRYAHRNFADVSPDAIDDRDPFRDATCWKKPISPVDARFSSGHMEPSARSYSGYCTGHADTCCHMDVRHEPEQHKQRDRDLVHSGCNS